MKSDRERKTPKTSNNPQETRLDPSRPLAPHRHKMLRTLLMAQKSKCYPLYLLLALLIIQRVTMRYISAICNGSVDVSSSSLYFSESSGFFALFSGLRMMTSAKLRSIWELSSTTKISRSRNIKLMAKAKGQFVHPFHATARIDLRTVDSHISIVTRPTMQL